MRAFDKAKRIAPLASLVLLTALSAACDGGLPPWNCTDKCPGNMKRDFFCNCYDPTEYKTKPPGGANGASSSLFSACTCLLEDGRYESHFRNKPTNFEGLVGHDVMVRTRVQSTPDSEPACEDLRVCPDLDPLPGFDHIHQVFFQGTFRQRVESANTYTGLVLPGQHWSVVGPVVGSAAIPFDTGIRMASVTPVVIPETAGPPFPSLQCVEHCTPGDEFCLRYALPTKYASPLRSVVADMFQAQGTSIGKNVLMSAFQQTSDDCQRSDLGIAGGIVTNSGEECVMTAVLNPGSGLAIRILLPAHLEGSLRRSGTSAQVSFTKPEDSPVVAFNNEDFEFDFGGEVRTAWISSDNMIVETFNGCSKVSF